MNLGPRVLHLCLIVIFNTGWYFSKQFDIIDEEEEDIEEFEFLQESGRTSNKDDDTDNSNFQQEVTHSTRQKLFKNIFVLDKKYWIDYQQIKWEHEAEVWPYSSHHLHHPPLQHVRVIIINISSQGEFHNVFLSPTDAVSVQISKLRYIVEELEILINDNFLRKKNDLLSRGNQTIEIMEENQVEKTNELRTELDKSKIKLAEMENQNAKNKVVVGGLCEKVTYFL